MDKIQVNEDELLRVGGIITTHGLKGEVKIFPTTDDVKRFKKLDEVYMQDHKGNWYLLHVASCKFFKDQVILKFKEFNDINEVEGYKKCELYVDREHAIPLEEGEYYIADLIDLDVISDDGTFEGTLTDVLQTGANDVYEITADNGKTFLLPAIKQCILDVDVEAGTMKIHILEGLLDL